MRVHLPSAHRIAAGPLFAVIFMPAAMGLAIAGCVGLTVPEAMNGQDWRIFAAALVKLCYLGTAAAHVGRFIMEVTDGGPENPAWWVGGFDDLPVPRPGADADAMARWHLFPNALDGALLAFALTTLVHRFG